MFYDTVKKKIQTQAFSMPGDGRIHICIATVQPAAAIHDGQMTIYARARVLCTDTEHSPAKLTLH